MRRDIVANGVESVREKLTTLGSEPRAVDKLTILYTSGRASSLPIISTTFHASLSTGFLRVCNYERNCEDCEREFFFRIGPDVLTFRNNFVPK